MKKTIRQIITPLDQSHTYWIILGIILLTAALSLLRFNFQVTEYQEYVETVKKNQDIDERLTLANEKLMALFDGKTIDNYNFTFHGSNTVIIPPPQSIFDIQTHYGTITRGNIQAGGPIHIRDVIINIFKTGSMGIPNTFSGLLFVAGSFVFLFSGFMLFYIKENPRLFIDAGVKKIFISKITASFLAIIILDAIIMTIALSLCHNHGLTLPIDSGILHIYLLFIIIHCLAFSTGVICALVGPYLNDMTWKGATIIFIPIILIGIGTVYITSICNDSRDKMENVIFTGTAEQTKLFFNMYGKLHDLGEKFGHGDIKTKQVQDIVMNYLNNDYTRVEALETQMIDAQKDYYTTASRYNKFSPLTFFGQMFYEIAGYGGKNSLEFNTYLRDKNRRYLKAVIDNVYFSDEKAGKTYYKDNEPLYYTYSNIPVTIYRGMGIFLLYILILLTIAYFRLSIIVPREIARIEMEKEREKERQAEWQRYWDTVKSEKARNGEL